MWLPSVPVGEEGGDERWLITYADMITLLLVLFIILYATANTDLEKFQALADSLAAGFGATSSASAQNIIPGDDGGSVFSGEGGGDSPVQMFPDGQIPIKIFDFAQMLTGEGSDMGGLRTELENLVEEAEASAEGLEGLGTEGAGIDIEYNERGIVISIFPDQILFDSGSATLKQSFRDILSLLSEQFQRLPNNIEVQGHTDNIPIGTATFPSNWELSAGRAGSVVRYMESLGLPA